MMSLTFRSSPAGARLTVTLAAMLLVVSTSATAFQGEAHILLERAMWLADLYNWAGATSDFSEAERLFVAAGDERNALWAKLGRIRATIEQNKRGLPAVAEELAAELDTNPILKADLRLRLFALVVKGDISAEVDTASMKSDWTEVQRVAGDLGDRKMAEPSVSAIGLGCLL